MFIIKIVAQLNQRATCWVCFSIRSVGCEVIRAVGLAYYLPKSIPNALPMGKVTISGQRSMKPEGPYKGLKLNWTTSFNAQVDDMEEID